MWDEVMPQLATDHRVVRFDMRGFGESIEHEQMKWRADRDVIAVMDAADLDHAVIVGVSMGGGAAIDTALASPLRVSGVVAVNPGISGFRADDGEWAVERFKQMKPAWDAGDKEEVARLEMEIWLAGPHRRLEDMPQDMVATMQGWLLVAYEKEPWNRQKDLEPPAADRLGEIDVPVLAVLGELDLPSLAATVGHIAENTAQGAKIVMPGVAHLAPWEQPNEFVAIVREFL
jgi:pimeloyl-ACP methyl ester carboxylesterase